MRSASDTLYGALLDRLAKVEASQKELEARLETDISKWDGADKRLQALEEAATRPRRVDAFEGYMTAKEMGHKLGLKGSTLEVLKYYARKHTMENGLEIKRTGGVAKRQYEYFPIESMKYAKEQIA
jgi:hypothetical protein